MLHKYRKFPPPLFDSLESRLLFSSSGSLENSDLPAGVSGLNQLPQSLPALSDSRAAASVGDLAFFAGSSGLLPTDTVSIYNARTGAGTSAHLSSLRFDLAIAAVDDKVLFIGGGVRDGAQSAVVDIYNVHTKSWTTANLSHGRLFPTAAVVGSKVLIANDSNFTPSSTVDIYDNSTGSWSVGNLSIGRDHMTAAAVGDEVLFAGGTMLTAGATRNVALSNVVDIYHNSTNSWSTSTLPVAASFGAVAVVGTKILFAGGNAVDAAGASKGSALVEIYDTASATWSLSTLSTPRRQMSATTLGRFVIFGGGSLESRATGIFTLYAVPPRMDVTDIYDSVTGRWAVTHLHGASNSIAATTVGSRAIFTGLDASENSAIEILIASSDPVGTIAKGPTGHVRVTLKNIGAVAQAANQKISLYAAPTANKRGQVAIGSLNLANSLAAGAAITLDIPFALPPSLSRSGGSFNLAAVLAPVSRGHGIIFATLPDAFAVRQLAVQRPTVPQSTPFTMNQRASTSAALLQTAMFSTHPIFSPAPAVATDRRFGKDQPEVLA